MDKTPLNSVSHIFVLNMTSPYGPLANYSNGKPIAQKTAEVGTLSYQAVMTSFGSVVVGTLWNSQGSNGRIVANGTSVMSTVLDEAGELGWMNDYPPKNVYFIGTLQQAIASEDPGQMWNGLDVVDDVQTAIPFKVALESLFQNITIGLMSSKLLQPNVSSPYAPPHTNVTFPDFQTVYVYTPSRLWIAYGLAIIFANTGVLIGLSSIFSSGVAYTNYFSTYFGQRHMQIWKPQFSQRMLTAGILYRSIWRRQVFCFPMIMLGGREKE